MSVPTVSLTIDDRPIEVPKGTNVVDAAQALGIDVPIFCHHPRLEPVGMCRMCLVDVGLPSVNRATGEVDKDADGHPVIRFGPKLQAGCTTQVSPGMVVRTATPAVADARRSVLEFLLSSHPLDCPVCDKGGECPLQNLTMRYGPGLSRFAWGEKFHFPKPVPIGPLIALDRERCVLCARCIRFEDEIAGDQVLGFENRGRGMEIVSFSDPPFRSYFSGNTSDICPVGALTTKDFRFEARAWEVVARPSICVHCPVGCNLAVDTRHDAIERIMPRENNAVNEIWLCDKGRFAHHFAEAADRLTTPLVRVDGELRPASWPEALDLIAGRLRRLVEEHGPAAVGAIAGTGLANEDYYVLGRLMRGTLGTNNVDHTPRIIDDDVLLRAGLDADITLTALTRNDVIVVVGLEVEEEAPLVFLNLLKGLRHGAEVIVVAGRPQKLDAHAGAVLRYRYGAVDSLFAALLAAVIGEPAGEKPSAELLALAKGVQAHEAATVAGQHPVDPDELRRVAALIAGAGRLVVAYGSEARGLGLVPALEALVGVRREAGAAAGLVAVGRGANAQGAADMGMLPDWLPGYRPVGDEDARSELAGAWGGGPLTASAGHHAEAMLAGAVRGLLVLGADPVSADPALAARLAEMEFVVVHELFLTATAAAADVVLPALSALEREGTFTNLQRRVQRFRPAAAPVSGARPDWLLLGELSLRLGRPLPFANTGEVMDEIARLVPIYDGLSYGRLGASPPPPPETMILPFAPQTEARKVSYEGTAYPNAFGVGLAWPPSGLPPRLGWRPDGGVAGAGLYLVPTERLYDAGTMLSRSDIVQPLVPPPYVVMSPFDAAAMKLAAGARVRLATSGGQATAELRIEGGVSPGTVLAPRSLAWEQPLEALIGGGPFAVVTIEAESGAGARAGGQAEAGAHSSAQPKPSTGQPARADGRRRRTSGPDAGA